MKLKHFKNINKYFSNMLLFFTITISITIFTVSIMLYINFEKVGTSIIHSFSKDSLSQVSYSTTIMTDTAKSLATQIYFNIDTSELLYSEEPDKQKIQIALNRLRSYHSTTPLLHSAYMYNGNNGTFYTSLSTAAIQKEKDFFDKDIVEMLNHFDDSKRLKPIPRKLYETYLSEDKDIFSNVYTFVFYDVSLVNNKVKKAVILNISEEWMRKTIKSLDTSKIGTTFIINNEGQTISGNSKEMMLTDLTDLNYIKQILGSDKPSDQFIANINGEKSLITFVTNDSIFWKFIRVTPYKVVMQEINNMKIRSMVICLFILICGLILSFFASKKVYKPIGSQLDKLNKLDAKKREMSIELKKEFIKNTLKNSSSYNLQITEKNIKEYDIRLSTEGSYQIILLIIDKYEEFKSRSINDRNLLKLKILNLASELSYGKATHEIIDMGDDHIVILLEIDTVTSTNHIEHIKKLSKEIQESVQKNLDISLSAIISSVDTCKFNNLDYLYSEVIDASQYRIFYGHKSVILAEEIYEFETNEKYEYPIQKEKMLLDALMLEKNDKVESIYSQMIEGTKNYEFSIFNSTILRLVFSINLSIDNFEKTSGFSVDYNFNVFIASLSTLETLEDVNSAFSSMFEFIINKLKERKTPKYDSLSNRVIEMINENYMQSNLSLNGIADKLNMSSTYLGRLFKKHASASVADYINEVRLKKAKEMLVNTGYSITEIAEKTGFSSSNYFYILFKKIHGVTPNEYRQSAVLKLS